MLRSDSSPSNSPRSGAPAARSPTIALVGNPNTGKTSLFNALTGFRRHTANYPGVTVEVARGRVRGALQRMELIDLPGTYSLAAQAPDEMIVTRALCGRLAGLPRPDAILAIVDAANPVRNFYLVSQLLEMGLPVVVALNMMDVARARGIEVDVQRLEARLGLPVIPVTATQEATVKPLVAALEAALTADPPAPSLELPRVLADETERLRAALPAQACAAEALRALLDEHGCAEGLYRERGGDVDALLAARARLRDDGFDPVRAEVQARYTWINQVLAGAIARRAPDGTTWTHRLDRILTARWAGAAVLLLVLYGIFYSIYTGAAPFMELVEGLLGVLGSWVTAWLPAGFLRSLIADGLIGGVGGVLAFLPQILILFLFIAVLEDCGYLARAAFMVDRLMRPLGLSGRAFIPLLSSFACAVPAILGTRAIADRRERLITILIAPFMSCSARLPVYVLLIGALVPKTAWLGGWLRLDALVMVAMYLVGVVVAIPIALLLKRTVLAGPTTGFLLELPSYKLPRVRAIFQRVYLAGRSFLVRAGTVILLVNLVVWALGYFPRSPATEARVRQQAEAEGWSAAQHESHLAGAYLRDSYLGRMGRAIEPAIRPLGWDWRIGVGVLSSFPAREVIIATLGTVCHLGQDGDGSATSLSSAVQRMTWEGTDRKLFTLPVALSLMVFFALCAQCSATLVVIARESGSWMWAAASFTGMTTLAFVAAWATSGVAGALLRGS